MRVLQVMSGAAHGGAETFFVSLAGAFARAGVEQRAVIRANAGRQAELEAAGLIVDTLAFARRFDFATPRALRRIAREFRPDVALTWMNRASSMMPGGDYVHVARLGGFYDIKYYRRASHLVCNTQGILEHVAGQGWPRERASYIPNFARVPPEPAADRRAHDTPEDAPLLVALGRLHENKALDVLLRALTRVPQAYLWIAGEGPERDALTRLADDLGVAGRVRFLGWRGDKGALFAAADICAFPSRREPFGNVVVEAWAAGTPLVATAAEGPGELVRDGKDGLLVPVDDDDALAKALTRLIGDAELRRRLAANGRRRYEAEFTEEVCVRAYLELFERLTHAGRRD